MKAVSDECIDEMGEKDQGQRERERNFFFKTISVLVFELMKAIL